MLDSWSRPTDDLAREAAIVRYIEETVDVGTQRVRSLPPPARCDVFYIENVKFAQFADWVGVRVLPASGHLVALYIMELLDHEASLDEIETAVEAIRYMHEMTHLYLDWLPIQAALEFASENC